MAARHATWSHFVAALFAGVEVIIVFRTREHCTHCGRLAPKAP